MCSAATTSPAERFRVWTYFDPAPGVGCPAGSLALPTHGSAAANLYGRIFVFGGASTVLHDVVHQRATGSRVST
jgi:hypothetical protein